MKGEVHSEYWVSCGRCGIHWHPDSDSWHPTANVYSKSEFIDKICELGWRLSDDGWVCPECIGKMKENEV